MQKLPALCGQFYLSTRKIETTRYTYDLRGNVVKTEDPDGDVMQDAYDAEGHKVAEVDADRNAQTWKYDYFGDVPSHTDIGGAQYFYTYDSQNRLVTTTYNGTVIDQREYDADSRVVKSGSNATSQWFFDTLGLSDQVQYNIYDGAGRLLFQRDYNANMQEQDNISYTNYDAVGNVLRYQVNSVQGTAYTNTYTNTLVRYSAYEVATQSGTSTVLQPGQTNYQYDVNGNLIGE